MAHPWDELLPHRRLSLSQWERWDLERGEVEHYLEGQTPVWVSGLGNCFNWGFVVVVFSFPANRGAEAKRDSERQIRKVKQLLRITKKSQSRITAKAPPFSSTGNASFVACRPNDSSSRRYSSWAFVESPSQPSQLLYLYFAGSPFDIIHQASVFLTISITP